MHISRTRSVAAIALAAITLLTRKSWMQWGVYACAAGGIAVAGFALAHV